MYRTMQYHIKPGHKLYSYCKNTCTNASKLYNRANYILRQYATAIRDFECFKPLTANQMSVFQLIRSVTRETKYEPSTKWMTYGSLDYVLKQTKDAAYYGIFSQANQQILKLLLRDYKSFFNALKTYKNNSSLFNGRPRMPKYKKENALSTAILTNQICKIQNAHFLKMPGTKTKLNLGLSACDDKLKEVRIKKHANVFVIDVVLEYADSANIVDDRTDKQVIDSFKERKDFGELRVLGIDPGLNNFCSVTNNCKLEPMLINGRTLKSLNHYYNKRLAKLKKEAMLCNQQYSTKRMERLHYKRNCKMKDKLHKISRYVANYAKDNNIDLVIIGHNTMQKQEINLGHVNNQHFVQIPFLVFANMLRYKLEKYGIRLVMTEESYTSKADFLALDEMPVYQKDQNPNLSFSGTRVKRGLYKHGDGTYSNADINGAANTIRKVFPNVSEWDRGIVNIPYAVTVA